jgi:hypothetical protein
MGSLRLPALRAALWYLVRQVCTVVHLEYKHGQPNVRQVLLLLFFDNTQHRANQYTTL